MSGPTETGYGRLRVLHCFRSPVGGLFRHVRDQVHYQQALDIDVGIVCDSRTGGDAAEATLAALHAQCTLGVHRIPLRRTVGLSDLVSIRRVLALCRQLKPHILHGHGAKGGALARLVARRIGASAIYTPHGGALHYENDSLRGRFYLSIERRLRQKSDGLIFESRFAERTYLNKIGQPDCPYRVIPNGLRADDFVPLDPGNADYDFVFVGELRELKGLATLLEALGQLRERQPFRALIVGDGPERSWCENQIRKHRLEAYVDIAAPMYPGRKALARGRCVVVPSLHESLPYIVLEAAAVARPIIASNAGGIDEIFGPRAAALVAAGDSKALATAMQTFLADPAAATLAADEIYRFVHAEFHADRMSRQTTEFYRSLQPVAQ